VTDPVVRVQIPPGALFFPGRPRAYYLSIGTMTKKQQPKKRKPGPKEERLIISEDPQVALAQLLKKTNKPKPR
jgi:hypothetical protein